MKHTLCDSSTCLRTTPMTWQYNYACFTMAIDSMAKKKGPSLLFHCDKIKMNRSRVNVNLYILS
jgi:hypothetical protein